MRTTKTTKLVALILSLLMLFTMIPLSVSAEGETKTILQVAQSDGNGNYYLTENVTVTATEITQFTGAFDGRGYTITTTVPLFNSVNGAVLENFTVAQADITDRAAVVRYIEGGATFRNITNKANITTTAALKDDSNYVLTATSGDIMAGGIAGVVLGAPNGSNTPKIIFENCNNSGNINATGNAGGILGMSMIHTSYGNSDYVKADVQMINCKNTGDISANYPGGIAGYMWFLNSMRFDNCYNSGTVSAANGNAGGILAATKNFVGDLSFASCINEGSVSSTSYHAAGIFAYLTGHGGKLTIEYCVNKGEITAERYGAGIVAQLDNMDTTVVKECGNEGAITAKKSGAGIHAYMGTGTLQILYCYNIATITSAGDGAGISSRLSTDTSVLSGCYNSGLITGTGGYLRQLSHGKYFEARENNYYTGNTDMIVYTENGDWTTNTTDGATEFTEAELKSGALTLAMNTAIGKTVYYQNINDKTTSTYPVTDPTHGYVFDYNGTLYSLAFFTLDGAGIRLDAVNHGIRFSTAVNKADYDVLTAAGMVLDFGTIITPDEYLAAAGNDFTDLAEGKYLDVNSEATGTDVFREVKGEDNTTYYFFCGSITGIKTVNYDWDYSAIGYVTINGITVYSANYTTRNAAYVANAAINDPNGEYSETELDILRGYLQ